MEWNTTEQTKALIGLDKIENKESYLSQARKDLRVVIGIMTVHFIVNKYAQDEDRHIGILQVVQGEV